MNEFLQMMQKFFMGSPESIQQVPRFTEGQQDLFSQAQQGVSQGLPEAFQRLFSIMSQDPKAMEAFEAPAKRQFQEEIVPSIAERFTGQFGEGSQRSSAFGQQLGQAGAGLSENLAAQRGEMGQNAMTQLMQMMQLASTPQFENLARPRQPGFGEQALRGGLSNIFSLGMGG